MRWEIGLVAQMAPAADHCQIDADTSALSDDSQNIDIDIATDFDRLLMENGRERTHLIAHGCGLLELEFGRERMHLGFELLHHLVLAAEQKARCVFDVTRVVLLADGADARGRATRDLMQQARPRTVAEY